jgi:hypothetical protein
LQLDPAHDLLVAGTYGRGAWSAQATGPAASLRFNLTSPSFAPQQAFDLTVRIVDSLGNPARSYTGTVAFSSSDGQATLPAGYTFTTADQGVHTFHGLILRTPGTQTITVQDQVNSQLSITQSVYVKGVVKFTDGVGSKNGLIHYDSSHFRLQQKLTLVFNGKQPVYGPFWVVLDGLSRGVKLRNTSGLTHALAPVGSPYLRIDVARLDPGQKVVLTLVFRTVSARRPHYTLRLLQGDGDL